MSEVSDMKPRINIDISVETSGDRVGMDILILVLFNSESIPADLDRVVHEC